MLFTCNKKSYKRLILATPSFWEPSKREGKDSAPPSEISQRGRKRTIHSYKGVNNSSYLMLKDADRSNNIGKDIFRASLARNISSPRNISTTSVPYTDVKHNWRRSMNFIASRCNCSCLFITFSTKFPKNCATFGKIVNVKRWFLKKGTCLGAPCLHLKGQY